MFKPTSRTAVLVLLWRNAAHRVTLSVVIPYLIIYAILHSTARQMPNFREVGIPEQCRTYFSCWPVLSLE